MMRLAVVAKRGLAVGSQWLVELHFGPIVRLRGYGCQRQERQRSAPRQCPVASSTVDSRLPDSRKLWGMKLCSSCGSVKRQGSAAKKLPKNCSQPPQQVCLRSSQLDSRLNSVKFRPNCMNDQPRAPIVKFEPTVVSLRPRVQCRGPPSFFVRSLLLFLQNETR